MRAWEWWRTHLPVLAPAPPHPPTHPPHTRTHPTGGQRRGAAAEPGAAVGLPRHRGDAPRAGDCRAHGWARSRRQLGGTGLACLLACLHRAAVLPVLRWQAGHGGGSWPREAGGLWGRRQRAPSWVVKKSCLNLCPEPPTRPRRQLFRRLGLCTGRARQRGAAVPGSGGPAAAGKPRAAAPCSRHAPLPPRERSELLLAGF